MAQIDCIRYLRHEEGKSIQELSRIMGINWRTAKKYADGNPPLPGRRPRQRRWRPVMGPYEELVDGWLVEDLRAPAKQRRTARAIFHALRDEHGFEGSERTVCRYVKERKQALKLEQQERFHRLDHSPGTAQIDFGHARLIDPETERTRSYPLLVVSFPHSNAAVARLLPAENSECFLFGMQSIFEQIGGVPVRLWFDNLSAAVSLISGNRYEGDMFRAFRWHYRFEAAFCNPGKGHEKGHVENKVGYVRRNFLTPLPAATNLDAANQALKQNLEQDMNRPHYRKKKPIAALWREDQSALHPLPAERYEICRTLTASANTVGEITVDGEVYHVARAMPGQKLFIKLYWDQLKVFDAYGEEHLATIPRTYIPQREQAIDWAAELRPFLRKPRAVQHATYLQALPEEIRSFVTGVQQKERAARLKILIDLFESGHGVEDIAGAVQLALETGRTDAASMQVLVGYQRTAKMGSQQPFAEPHTPAAVRQWRPRLGVYDLLALKDEAL